MTSLAVTRSAVAERRETVLPPHGSFPEPSRRIVIDPVEVPAEPAQDPAEAPGEPVPAR